MTVNNRDEYINYRFHRAEESFEEALILAGSDKWNAVINRLYYASFYAIIALLLKNDIETQSHDGVRTQFGLNFVLPGKIDKSFGKLFSKLGDYRQKGDYGDLYDFDENIVRPLIGQTQLLILEIKKLIDYSSSSSKK